MHIIIIIHHQLCWSSPQAQHIQSMKLIWRPLDLILLLLLMAAMAFTVLRGLVRCDVHCTQWSISNLTCVNFLMPTGGDGLSIRGLQCLPPTLRTIPKGPSGLPPSDGDQLIYLSSFHLLPTCNAASARRSSCYLMTILTEKVELWQLASRCHCSSWNGTDWLAQTERKLSRVITASSDEFPALSYVDSCRPHICTSQLPSKWCGSLDNSQTSSVACLGASACSRAPQIQTALCSESAGSSPSWRPETLFIATLEGRKASACLSCVTKQLGNRFWLRLLAAVWSSFIWSQWPDAAVLFL